MTLTVFAPTNAGPFQFIANLDGSDYTVQVTWNLWGQRWYINIYTLNGTLVLCTAMVGSPKGYDINLVKGYFNSSFVWRPADNVFEVLP